MFNGAKTLLRDLWTSPTSLGKILIQKKFYKKRDYFIEWDDLLHVNV